MTSQGAVAVGPAAAHEAKFPAASPGTDGLRVAAVIDAASVSGPARQLAALARELASHRVLVHVVTFHRRGRPRSAFADFLEAAGVPVTVLHDDGPADVRLIWRLKEALGTIEPHVVQSHGYRPTALVFALRRLGVPVPWIAFFHGETFENRKVRLYNWLDRRLMPHADRIVVMSERHLDRFGEQGGRVRVVHNAAIPVAEDPRARERAAKAIASRRLTAPVIGVLGRLSPEKGVDIFLEAAATLMRSGQRFTAIVAGDGPERDRLEAQRSALDLDGIVHFVGAMDAVSPVYDALDVLVIPSRSEGLPNVLLEALRADVPVVATDVGAIREVVRDTRAAIIVRPESAAELAGGIAAAIEAQDDEEASHDRRAAAERMSLGHRAQEHLRLYREVMSCHGAAGASAWQPSDMP